MSEENFCEDPRHGDSVKLYCQICLSSKLREAKKIAEQRGLERAFQSHINHLEDTTSLKGCHFCEAYEKGRASVRKEHRIDCHDCCKEHYEDGQRDGRAEGIDAAEEILRSKEMDDLVKETARKNSCGTCYGNSDVLMDEISMKFKAIAAAKQKVK